MSLQLRPYQREAVDSISRYFEANSGNPIICVPTGGGKTAIMATFIREAIESWPDTRVVLLSHVKELLEQSMLTLLHVWNDAPVSLYSAGLKSKSLHGQIVVAGIQSIYKKSYDLQRVDLVLIDECHLLGESDTGMYRRFLNDLKTINGGHVPVIGFSATPWREAGGLLHRGEKALFTDIAFEVGMGELIEQSYLAPLRCKHTATQLDVTGVRVRQGDYAASELQAAVDRQDINEAIVAELLEKGRYRKAWLLFASGVEHGRHLCELINRSGVQAACVFGETPNEERDDIVKAFRSGQLRCLVNVAALLIGFDAPQVDLIGVARPTKSKGRYVQMLGRGVRLAPGKTDCLVLDWAGVVAQHGPVDLVRGTERRKSSGSDEATAPPMKVCPSCEEQVHASVRHCPACDHEWPTPDLLEKLHDRAIESAVLARELTSDWLEVTYEDHRIHRKPGSPPSLRVDYAVGIQRYSIWVCFEHEGYARQKAARWWGRRGGRMPAPASVTEALERIDELTPIARIRIRPDGKFFRVVAEETLSATTKMAC